MKRVKKHKIKSEKPEPSASHSRQSEDYDLTYYIHDRVELVHQVFSALRQKDIKAMAPECVRHISIDDLQELCTEELLGISSKRLCAILDGAEPPSDTESSASPSPERLETISLDSISSDDEILSQASSKRSKKHKHRRRNSKSKKKKSKEDSKPSEEDADRSRASRAGLTVLELLELQARARAIRAQLQKEQAAKKVSETAVDSDTQSDSDVQVKEEPPEVLEISSEDEKPDPHLLIEKASNNIEPDTPNENSKTVTKKINDLIITVPQTKLTRKIKLKRSKVSVPVINNEKSNDVGPTRIVEVKQPEKTNENKEMNAKEVVTNQTKEKNKKKHKKKKKNVDKDSDHDEITLQLSDSEKMDLLEGLDRKNYEQLSSSSSEDSESSSSDTGDESQNDSGSEIEAKQKTVKVSEKQDKSKIGSDTGDESQNDSASESKTKQKTVKVSEKAGESKIAHSEISKNMESDKETNEDSIEKRGTVETVIKIKDTVTDTDKSDVTDERDKDNRIEHTENKSDNICIDKKEYLTPCVKSIESIEAVENPGADNVDGTQISTSNSDEAEHQTAIENDQIDQNKEPKEKVLNIETEKSIEVSSVDDIPIRKEKTGDLECESENVSQEISQDAVIDDKEEGTLDKGKIDDTKISEIETELQTKDKEAKLSDGELSERESSDIEAMEVQPEVVCISDDETEKKSHKKKKNKKKEKKNKKEKKSKKSKSDFRESGDQNFYKEKLNVDISDKEGCAISLDDDDDDVYEILEISDDSSCYEVEGTVLSKEPTAEEIEALSARIDEINREDVVTEEEIREHERKEAENNENIENISWKDRYLDSKKVKKVLSTSNIFNALRKKNRELKKKLEESKIEQLKEAERREEKQEVVEDVNINIEEGSIDHFNTLQGSTKFVDPVTEIEVELNKNDNELTENGKPETSVVSKEMKKEAKQILKMYKRLLKYNVMPKPKDPNKKKKEKSKKNKENKDSVASSVTAM